jgi:hypothetical protein
VPSRRAAALVLLALAPAACRAAPPDVEDNGAGGPDAGAPYADAVLGWFEEGAIETCTVGADACGSGTACGPTEVLGPPDGATFAVEAGELIEVALLCSHVLERGDDGSADLKLWATFAEGAGGVVEVSYDGTEWISLATVDANDPELDLQREELEVVRFVRLTNRGTAAIALDAVEALR